MDDLDSIETWFYSFLGSDGETTEKRAANLVLFFFS